MVVFKALGIMTTVSSKMVPLYTSWQGDPVAAGTAVPNAPGTQHGW